MMGMRLVTDHTGDGPPWPVTLTVTCDAAGLFLCETKASFDATDWHPREPAIRAGWKFTGDGLVFCPSHARRGGNG